MHQIPGESHRVLGVPLLLLGKCVLPLFLFTCELTGHQRVVDCRRQHQCSCVPEVLPDSVRVVEAAVVKMGVTIATGGLNGGLTSGLSDTWV